MIDVVNKNIRMADGFINFVSKIGMGAQNQISNATYTRTVVGRNREKLANMHRTSWLTGVTIDTTAEDMIKKGIDITGEIEPSNVVLLQNKLTELGIWTKLKENIIWGRLFGGCIAGIEIKGQNPSTPLNIETIAKDQFQGLVVYDRFDIQPSMNDLVDDGGIYHGLPKYYRVLGSDIKYHYTRVIRHIGIKLAKTQEKEEEYWGASLIERLEAPIIGFDTTAASINSLISKSYLRVIGIEGLRDILAAGGDAEKAVIAQFHYMTYLQNTEGITLTDKEDSFAAHRYAFAGLDEVLMGNGKQVSGACKTPMIKLFGQSPDGMNATGESDMRLYYDGIETEQETHLREPLTRILKVVYWSAFGKAPSDDLSFTFTSLWQMSEKEKAEIALAKTNTIMIAYDSGVIDDVTALKELKQLADVTGMFDNITDAMIKIVENRVPEAPEVPELDVPKYVGPVEEANNREKPKKKITDWLGFRDAKKKCKGCLENVLTDNPYDQKYGYCEECFPNYKSVCEECGNIYDYSKTKCPKCGNKE
jgi:hypothetical protein